MYYLVQSNIQRDPEHYRIFEALESLGLDYEPIELLPTDTELRVKTQRTDVFVYGSVRLARLALERGWQPGSFYGGNHWFEAHAPHYGEEMLNFGAHLHSFGETLRWDVGESKFIKPAREAKIFTGRVFTEPEWTDFVYESLAAPRTPLLHRESPILVSAPNALLKEARVWIVGGQVAMGGYYRYHGNQPFEPELSPEALEYARAMARRFEVAAAFVLDIGLTPQGWKIVEINCVNSAGLFQNSPRTLLRALEAHFG